MAKGSSVKVRLESEAGTGFRYYAKRSTRAEYKIKKKKYHPWLLTPRQGIAARMYGLLRRKCRQARRINFLFSLICFKIFYKCPPHGSGVFC